jgi:2,3-bisphosphoglycerate-independent phosphoglycerate mutase
MMKPSYQTAAPVGRTTVQWNVDTLRYTYHTTNPVPFLLIDENNTPLRANGALQDISPTILSFLGEKQPKEMSGRDLRM